MDSQLTYIVVTVLPEDGNGPFSRKLFINYPTDSPREIAMEHLLHVYPHIGMITCIHVDDFYVNNRDVSLYACFGMGTEKVNEEATNAIKRSWGIKKGDDFIIHGPVVFFAVADDDIPIDFPKEHFNAIF